MTAVIKRRFLLTLWLTGMSASLAGCSSSNTEMIKIIGGGFVFNYRYSRLNYGVVVKPLQPLPEGAKLEAHFDLPATSEKSIVSKPVIPGTLRYAFESEALTGVTPDQSYKVEVRLISADGKLLATAQESYKPQIDQSKLPNKPSVTGNSYAPAPQD